MAQIQDQKASQTTTAQLDAAGGDPLRDWTSPKASDMDFDAAFRAGTTSIQAADDKGWAISVTPSGGWLPACVAGNTGIGMSQRMQSFVLDADENPFNVVAPGKRPRVTLTPSLALKGGKPFLCFSVQGGDTQDQNLLQFFLNVVEFGMNVQEAVRSGQYHELPDAQLFRQSRRPTWPRHAQRGSALLGPP